MSVRAGVFALAIAAAWLSCCPQVLALNGRWQPPDIRPAALSLPDVLSKHRAALGSPEKRYAQRTEHYVLQAGEAKLVSTFSVRNDDFRASTTIDEAVYEQGRRKGLRWRRTPAGLVRVIESDIQGDDLDRWPLALLPVCAADCALAGETAGASAAWVVQYRPRHEYPHWFYIDETTGFITREVMREGSRVNSIAFDDFRPVAGTRRPYHWRVTGAGGLLDVTVDAIDFTPVDALSVEIPPSNTDLTAAGFGRSMTVPTQFDRARILVNVTVNGRPLVFLLDSGTTQIIFDDGVARRLGIRSTLGHALITELSVGAARLQNAAVETVPLGRGFGFAGILGYDFFAGHIVHVDYQHERVELIERSAFTPPAKAFTLDAWCGEGLPLIPVPFGDAVAQRFALDTGSLDVLLTRDLFDRNGVRAEKIGLGRPFGGVRHEVFLEGPVAVERAMLRSIRIGRVTIKDVRVLIELPDAGETIEIPLDGIIGARILTQFEWWFDYDGDRVWFQPS